MNRLIFILLLSFFALFRKGQSSELLVNYDYFLLGTLNDYMGREKYKEVVNRVDEYYQSNKSLVFLLDSVFHYKYPDLLVTTNIKTDRLELQSKSLAQKMNDFYLFKPSGRSYYCGEEDFETLNLDSLTKTPDFYTTYFDSVYTGGIKHDIFKNDAERFSFITGAFIRFGVKTNSLYYISVKNSVSKVRIVSEQLKELKCTNVEHVIHKGSIPTGNIVYFTPSEELENYFEKMKGMLVKF
jgi:hypothetical protein